MSDNNTIQSVLPAPSLSPAPSQNSTGPPESSRRCRPSFPGTARCPSSSRRTCGKPSPRLRGACAAHLRQRRQRCSRLLAVQATHSSVALRFRQRPCRMRAGFSIREHLLDVPAAVVLVLLDSVHKPLPPLLFLFAPRRADGRSLRRRLLRRLRRPRVQAPHGGCDRCLALLALLRRQLLRLALLIAFSRFTSQLTTESATPAITTNPPNAATAIADGEFLQ